MTPPFARGPGDEPIPIGEPDSEEGVDEDDDDGYDDEDDGYEEE